MTGAEASAPDAAQPANGGSQDPDVAQLQQALAEHLGVVLAARYAQLLAGWNGEVDETFSKKLRGLRLLGQRGHCHKRRRQHAGQSGGQDPAPRPGRCDPMSHYDCPFFPFAAHGPQTTPLSRLSPCEIRRERDTNGCLIAEFRPAIKPRWPGICGPGRIPRLC